MKNQLSPRINLLEKNVLIDGGMELWPEGTSRSVPNNTSLYGAVMFQCNNSGMGITVTNSQDSSIPVPELKFSNKITKTVSGTVGANSAINLQYGIEGFDLQNLMYQEFTVVFWVKSSVISKRSVSIRNSLGTHGYVNQYDINVANTWELKARKFNQLSTCPGTINRDNTIGILLDFAVVTGANGSTSTLNQWVSGGVISGTGEDTTFVTGTNHDFAIAGAMVLTGDWTSLEANPSAYRFLRATNNIQQEIAASQRYFEKSYEPNTVAGSVTNLGSEYYIANAGGSSTHAIRFKVAKRTAPTLAIYNPTTGVANQSRDNGGVNVAATAGTSSTTSFSVDGTGAAGAGNRIHWTADSRF